MWLSNLTLLKNKDFLFNCNKNKTNCQTCLLWKSSAKYIRTQLSKDVSQNWTSFLWYSHPVANCYLSNKASKPFPNSPKQYWELMWFKRLAPYLVNQISIILLRLTVLHVTQRRIPHDPAQNNVKSFGASFTNMNREDKLYWFMFVELVGVWIIMKSK